MISEKRLCVNVAMRKLLHGIDGGLLSEYCKSDIKKLVLSEINTAIEQDNVIALYQPNINMPVEDILSSYDDLTTYECACNEIYINSEIGDRLPIAVISLKNALKYALGHKFSNRQFRIIISVDCGEYIGINAWFHLNRENENYFDPNIENYEQPAMYLEIAT